MWRGRGPCQLLQPPRGPRASAPGRAPAPSLPRADCGPGGRAGGDSGHRGPRGTPTTGRRAGALPLALFLCCGDSWPGSLCGTGRESGCLLFCGSDGGGEGFRQGRRRTPDAPPPPSPSWRSRVPRAGQAGKPDLEDCENARGGVPRTGARLGLGIAGVSGENPERQLGAVTSTEC